MTRTQSPRSLPFWRKLVASRPRLLELTKPRLNEYIPHRPTPKQSAFLLLSAREALYGGAAGGGKSDALLMAALQYVDVAGYAALLLRRTYSDLSLPGALLDRAQEWLRGTDASWNGVDKTWTFPSGATLTFGYLDHPEQKYRYQSSEFQFIGFDELTQFSEAEYRYLFSRLRRLASSSIPPRMRSASNPGGLGHDWVRRRFLHEGPVDGRVFIPARLADNPHLDQRDYLVSLEELDPLTRARLLEGDWNANDNGLLSFEAIEACTADCLWPEGVKPEGSCPELFVGVDIGRTQDRTVVWTWEKVGDVAWCREIYVMRGASFGEQREAIERRLGRWVVKCAIDKGGIGRQLAEELEKAHPGIVEGVQLSAGVQGKLARRLAVGFGERKVRVPVDGELREDLRLVRKTKVVGGVDRVETLRGESGHADRFWSAALGYDAIATQPKEEKPKASLPRAYSRQRK